MAGRGGRPPAKGVPVQIGPPPDYVDPELQDDKLPMPYRMIAKLVDRMIDAAVDGSERGAVHDPRVYRDPPGLRDAAHTHVTHTMCSGAPPGCVPGGTDYVVGRTDGCFERHSAALRMATMRSKRADGGEGPPAPLLGVSPSATTIACTAAATATGVRVVCYPPPAPRVRRSERSSSARAQSQGTAPRSSMRQPSAHGGSVSYDEEDAADQPEEERQQELVAVSAGDKLPAGCRVSTVALSPCARYLTVTVTASTPPLSRAMIFKVAPIPASAPPPPAGAAPGDPPPPPPPAPPAELVFDLTPPAADRVSVPQPMYVCDQQTFAGGPRAHSVAVAWLGQNSVVFASLLDQSPNQLEAAAVAEEASEQARLRAAADEPPGTASAPAAAAGAKGGRKPSLTKADAGGPGRRPHLADPIGLPRGIQPLDIPGVVTAASLNPTHELIACGCQDGLLRVHSTLAFALVLSVTCYGPERPPRPAPGSRFLCCHAVRFWRRKYVAAAWSDDSRQETTGTFAVCDLGTADPLQGGDHVQVRPGGSGEWVPGTVVRPGEPSQVRIACSRRGMAGEEEVAVSSTHLRRPEMVIALRHMPAVRAIHCSSQLPLMFIINHESVARVFDLTTLRIAALLVLPAPWTAIGCGPDRGLPVPRQPVVYASVLISLAASAAASLAATIRAAMEPPVDQAPAAKAAAKKPAPKGGAPPAADPADSAKERAEEARLAAQKQQLQSALEASAAAAISGAVPMPEELLLCGLTDRSPDGSAQLQCAGFSLRDVVSYAYPVLGEAIDEHGFQIHEISTLMAAASNADRNDRARLRAVTAQAGAMRVPGAPGTVTGPSALHGSLASGTGTRRRKPGSTTQLSKRSSQLGMTDKEKGGTDKAARVEFATVSAATTSNAASAKQGLTFVDEEEQMVNEGLLPAPGPRECCQTFLAKRSTERAMRQQRMSRYLEELRGTLR
eukprot:TRINITY_DN4295_c0_g1_i1.p1 TRINITY_DN4295_c0_g1~~TRINITY_DN4295_c0_g1_i1.p1  ORF type:complete len:981 (+),score=221.08 TRINITY_DN4295_c0_g1_i1:81-2945(+)